MEFILHDSFHEEHDNTWAIFSQHYSSPVCLGCIVEILEDSGRLGIQKKPAISELHRLLTYQSGDLLQLFQQEEQVVWHLAEILLRKNYCKSWQNFETQNIWAVTWQNLQNECAPSKDSDQPWASAKSDQSLHYALTG